MADEKENSFIDFELHAVWEKYNELKARDSSNYTRLMRLYALMILYASAPFYFERFRDSGLLRVWGLGGLWLAGTTWFIIDRDFRAYGLHLKERMLCTKQLAILRSLCMANNARYLAETLYPLGDHLRRRGADRGFPERVSPGAIEAAAYFFKFLSLFPLMYLYLFSALIFFPVSMIGVGRDDSFALFLRMVLAGSGLLYFWLYISSARCVQLQRQAFTARRISIHRPWPSFPRRQTIASAGHARVRLRKFLVVAAGLLSVANLARGGQLLASSGDMWDSLDIVLGLLTGWLAAAGFAFSEIDIRRMMGTAKRIDPIRQEKAVEKEAAA